jgi:hypothetical protein
MIKFRNFILEEKGLDEQTINIRAEVESLLKRKMTPKEFAKFKSLRLSGMANSMDIKRELMKEETDLDEAMSPEHKKVAQEVHKQLKRDEPMAAAAGLKFKATHSMLRSKYGDDWRKKAGIKEEADLDEAKKTFSDYADEYKKLTGKKAPAGTSTQAMMLMVDKAKRAKSMKEETDLDEGKAAISAAIKRSEAAHKVALNKAKRWMKQTGKSAEDAVKEFDLFKNDVKHLKEETELDESVKHDRYMRAHGKKAKNEYGNWMFTTKRDGDDENAVNVRGKLSDAAAEAKKKLNAKVVYVMESSTKQMSPALKALFDKMDKEYTKQHNTHREKELARVAALPKEKPLSAAEKAKLTAELKKLQSQYSSLERSDAPGTATKLGHISSDMDRIRRALKAK